LSADRPDGRSASPRRRSLAIQGLAIAALLALVAIAIAGLVPGSSARLRDASATWIAAAVAAELIACAGYTLLFHGVFSGGEHQISLLRSTQIGLGELAGFVVTPTGAGGPALRLWALMRSGMPFRAVITRSVVHGAVLQIPYVIAAVLLGAGALLRVGVGHAQTLVALAPDAVVIGAVLLVLAVIVLARRPARAEVGWRRVVRVVVEAIPAGVSELPAFLRKPALLLTAVAYWAGDCGVLVLAFHALHGSAPIAVIALAYMLGQLGNSLPLPGGVGAVEPAMLGVLGSSGVDLGLGAAAVVVYRFISLGLQSVLGAVGASTLIPSLQRPSPAGDPEGWVRR
jgi:uncharacterized membrane protein YbhN (UPF0104 family)